MNARLLLFAVARVLVAIARVEQLIRTLGEA